MQANAPESSGTPRPGGPGEGSGRNRRRRPRRSGERSPGESGRKASSEGDEGSRPRQAKGDPAPGAGATRRAEAAGERRSRPAAQEGEGRGRSGDRRRERSGAAPRQDSPAPAAQEGAESRSRGSRRRGSRSGGAQAPAEDFVHDLADWAFEHDGYTIWTARMRLIPPTSDGRAWRSYIVDVHCEEFAVDRRLLPEIVELLELSVRHVDEAAGRDDLARLFADEAGRLNLPPAEQYRGRLPEDAVSPFMTPAQTALGTLQPLDLDTDQETIDLLNEGRRP
jgi:hypothetical protein